MQLPWRPFDRPVRAWTRAWPLPAAFWLIAANVLVFVAQRSVSRGELERWSAPTWESLRAGRLWQPLTGSFLHAGWLSLALGSFTLWLVGRRLEAIVGRRHFLALYLGGGVAGLTGQALYDFTWRQSLDGGGQVAVPVMGSAAGTLAALTALACIAPGWELPLFGRRVHLKTWRLAAVMPLAAVVTAIGWRGGAVGMQPAAWLIGPLAGCLYARQLGFGQRLQVAAPAEAAAPAPAASLPAETRGGSQSPRMGAMVAPAPGALATVAPAAAATTPRLTERERRMSARQFIAEHVDPILDKISLHGLGSLTEEEHRVLEKGREKISQKS